MNTEKCRLLLQVIQAGSFSSAAERLGYTPSGVMRSIASLEKEIGFPLLGRTAQGIYLTREGRQCSLICAASSVMKMLCCSTVPRSGD
ncbi:LysR family transcriptional regulator [Megasphaera sp. BL7]|uniref:helix-turn-helix domain-containing protein n=1 Tax=Megasphaera sp. BL7 TaxID=1285585 RepID=UPI001EF9F109|nr:LysR family transcriptional regulator [Megasphaera sp. BL7]